MQLHKGEKRTDGDVEEEEEKGRKEGRQTATREGCHWSGRNRFSTCGVVHRLTPCLSSPSPPYA